LFHDVSTTIDRPKKKLFALHKHGLTVSPVLDPTQLAEKFLGFLSKNCKHLFKKYKIFFQKIKNGQIFYALESSIQNTAKILEIGRK
jgi:hypothetical protein